MAATAAARGRRRAARGRRRLVRENLFSSTTNTILTLLACGSPTRCRGGFAWAFLDATWDGEDGGACSREGAGACWPFVAAKFGQFMYGRYPDAERWRVNLTYALAMAGLVPLMVPRIPGKLWSALYLIGIFPCRLRAAVGRHVSASPTCRPTCGADCW